MWGREGELGCCCNDLLAAHHPLQTDQQWQSKRTGELSSKLPDASRYCFADFYWHLGLALP